VMIQVEVFYAVTPRSDAVGYHRFGGSCCIHRQAEMMRGPPTLYLSDCTRV
jgi:hypothetical protein